MAKRAFVGELSGDQWIKWATVSAPAVARASILFLVNGGQDPNNEGSGLLELNLVRQVENVSLVVCSGYIEPENFAYVINGTSIDLYVYCQSHRDYQIAVLDELIGTTTNKNTYVTFSNVGTGSTTLPEGGVYATVHNIASYLIDDAILNNTAVGDIGYNTAVANRTKLVTMNSIAYWNGAYQDTTSNLTYAKTPSTNSDTNEIATTARVRDIVPGIKVNNAGSADTAARLTTGRTVRVNLASSSAVTFNGTANITPGVTGILPVANGGTGASSLSSITVGNASQLGGVVASKYARLASPAFTGTPTAPTPSTSDDSTKIATTAWVHNQNYLTTIPSASQTVLGGVKVYTDSGGYLCIDTE